MAKYAVHTIVHRLSEDTKLKKLSLLFDKVYTGWYKVDTTSKEYLLRTSPEVQKAHKILLAPDYKLFDFLLENEIIKELDAIPVSRQTDEYFPIINETQALIEYFIPRINQKNISSVELDDLIDRLADSKTRLDAITVSNQLPGDFFPILRNPPPIISGNKKENIVRLLLNNIPDPDPETPWEQIIDFRSDAETRIKYLALINWANEMASSSLSENEIQEKYEYLYLQYLKAFKQHKIKSTFGVLEILTALGFSLSSGSIATIPTLVSNFFKDWELYIFVSE